MNDICFTKFAGVFPCQNFVLIKAGAYKCGVFLSIRKYDISYPQGGYIFDVYVQVVLAPIPPT